MRDAEHKRPVSGSLLGRAASVGGRTGCGHRAPGGRWGGSGARLPWRRRLAGGASLGSRPLPPPPPSPPPPPAPPLLFQAPNCRPRGVGAARRRAGWAGQSPAPRRRGGAAPPPPGGRRCGRRAPARMRRSLRMRCWLQVQRPPRPGAGCGAGPPGARSSPASFLDLAEPGVGGFTAMLCSGIAGRPRAVAVPLRPPGPVQSIRFGGRERHSGSWHPSAAPGGWGGRGEQEEGLGWDSPHPRPQGVAGVLGEGPGALPGSDTDSRSALRSAPSGMSCQTRPPLLAEVCPRPPQAVPGLVGVPEVGGSRGE